jgi:hypothetical protein
MQTVQETSKTPIVIAFIAVVMVFLIFAGGALADSGMVGGTLGHRTVAGLSWIWIPTFFTMGLGVMVGLVLFRKS